MRPVFIRPFDKGLLIELEAQHLGHKMIANRAHMARGMSTYPMRDLIFVFVIDIDIGRKISAILSYPILSPRFASDDKEMAMFLEIFPLLIVK